VELEPSPVDPGDAGVDVPAPAMPEPDADDTVLDDGPGSPVTDDEPGAAPAGPDEDPPAGRHARTGQGEGDAATLRDPGDAVTGARDADSSASQ
jgi:hypothetical protein